MYTSITGYPRIGAERELKFASEKYFRGDISRKDLEKTATNLRAGAWKKMYEAGVDFIPSNDFSFYDGMLDTATLLNVVPQRYRALGLEPLDEYFSMARGYQGDRGDVKALAMKKWFNTNYHYMVPEIDDNTKIFLMGDKPFREYKEAKNLGIETKPVVIGPYTFLKLARFLGKKTEKDFAADTANAYVSLLSELSDLGTHWLQLDEPCLVFDMTKEDTELFTSLYERIFSKTYRTKVLLETYFGDVRDCYKEITSLPFSGIGLDFVEGDKTLELVKTNGFPKDKILFAGIVNGKNIWKNNYQKTLSLLEEIAPYCGETAINTSCSLLHVPVTVKNETRLPLEYLDRFAFAEEKITELEELKSIAEAENREKIPAYRNNVKLFGSPRSGADDEKVRAAVKAIKESDCTRLPAFAEREKIQKERFGLPLFPTTTIGSFPQTADVKTERAKLRKGEITEEEYEKFTEKKIAECVELQESLGLDVLVHGEYERNDMVEYFGERLKGFLFTEKAWVQSYGTRCVKPPIVWGDVSREKPMTVKWSVYAQSLTTKPMKGMLTGPVTILNWSFPREDISVRESTLQIALAIRAEVLDLEKNGIRVIQIDEAALREKLPLRKCDWFRNYLDWAIPAFRLVHSGVKPETQIHTHMCYSEFTDIIKAIDDMDADVITFEASRSDLLILDSLKENNFKTEVGPGVYDIHSPRVPSKEEIVTALEKMVEKLPKEKLWVNPDCGLKTRERAETEASLANMTKAALELRAKYSD
ncbi:MAG: 5-methyltetrahydropteroyltriglutamate--homocysteine S-methyltransferase [Clostridia bacterium]|nr:5-methyltetrahydropteroyltriglutamate--homocysteine S-methyltransferase [Clostridia bacterium]